MINFTYLELPEISDAVSAALDRALAKGDPEGHEKRYGMLVDVTEAAAEAGSRIPVALTSAAWADCVAWGELDSRRHKVHLDEAERLRDVLTMAVHACRRQQGNDVARFYLSRIPRLGRGRYVELIARIGAGAQGKPVATIMLAGED